MNKKSGFTLVELSIVMIIIGLLIGGILKGQALVENARVSKTIALFKSVEAATNIFYDSHRAFPGDMGNAVGGLPGCDASNFCVNGNGNYIIGTPYTGGVALGAKFYTDSETVQFWKHLALADLIGGINGAANPTAPEWGKSHPASPLGGGLEVYYEASGLFNGARGQFLRFSAQGLHPTLIDDNGQGATTPAIAERIDQKLDDGFPRTGNVVAWDYGNHGCDNLLNGDPGFDSTVAEKYCVIFFRLGK